MSRLPIQGGDQGNWGTILNDYLSQSHSSDGTLKPNSVGTTQLKTGAVTTSQIADNSISANHLASDAVTQASIANGSIGTTQLDSTINAVLTKANTSVQSVNSYLPVNGAISLNASDIGAVSTGLLGALSGVATLDGSGELTSSQLPTSVVTKSTNSSDAGKAVDAFSGLPLAMKGIDLGVISVKEAPYNATGDGVTDDSAAIQGAIDQARDNGGGVVYFPSGVYRVGTRVKVRTNVSLVGADQQTTIIKAMPGIVAAVVIGLSSETVSNVAIRELTVDADYSNSGLDIVGIQITSGSKVFVEHCMVNDCAKSGILFDLSTECKVIHSTIQNTGRGQASVGFGVLLSDGSHHKVHDNEFYSCNGMNIGGNNNSVHASIVNNLCDHTGTPRTTVAGAGQSPSVTGVLNVVSTAGFPPEGTLTIAGLLGTTPYTGLTPTSFTGCSGASGTAVDGGVARNGYESIGFTAGCENWIVKSNRSIDSGDNGISASADHSIVEGNVIDSPQYHGIALAGGTNSLVIGNIIRNVSTSTSSGYSGIRVTDQTNSIIALNRIYDDRGGSALMRSGIREQGNSTNATYIGNRITGHLSQEYELVSPSTPSQLVEPRRYTSITVSAPTTVQTDVATSRLRRVTVASSGDFTMAAPTNKFIGASVTYLFANTSGGAMGIVTWDPVFHLAGTWAAPNNGESKGITFVYDGSSWVEAGGTASGGSGGVGNANLETAVATFARNSVAAGANSNLACNALYGTSNIVRWPLIRDAKVVGVSIAPTSALTGGTLTAKITKNGSVQASLNTVINSGESSKVLDVTYAGGVSFNSGESIGVQIDTDASFGATQNVIVLVHYTTT
jgi:Pectate lyase superfamily protein/Right handed beta helix region